MNTPARWSWYALLACIALTPLATTATSMRLASLPLTYDQFVIPKLAALGVLSAIALGLYLAGMPEALRWRRSAYAGLALLGLAGLSTAFALDPAVAVFGKDAANGLAAYLCYGAVFFLILQQVTGTSRVVALTRAVVASASVVSVFTLYQASVMTSEYVGSLGLGAVGFLYGRGGGLMGNPDYVGAFLVVPQVLALASLASEKETLGRVLAGVASALIGAALVVTQVRGAWIGVVVGLVALAVLLYARKVLSARRLGVAAGIAAGGVVVGALIASVPLLLVRLGSGAGGSLDEVSSGRLSGWAAALKVIGDRPLLGTGPDSFTLGWYRHATALADRVTASASYFEDPHNLYLAIAATMGVPALIALLALCALAIRAGLANVRLAAGSPERTALYAGWLAAFAGLLAVSFFAVTTIPTTLLLFVTAAVLLAPSAHSWSPSGGARMGVIVSAGTVTTLCFALTVLPLVADFQLGQYMRTRSEATLASARSLAPWNKTIQSEYLSARRAALLPTLQQLGENAEKAADAFDSEMFALVQAHPHELQYSLERIDVLGQAAGLLGGKHAEKALSVVNLALLDYPSLTDLKVAKARALNNLNRSSEAVELLLPLERSVTRDAALVESYLLLKQDAPARELLNLMVTEYAASPYAQSFLSQPSITPYLSGQSAPATP